MASDTSATIEKALAVLRQQYGQKLDGPRMRTEARLRQTLQQKLNLDELTADRLMEKLFADGRLVYVGDQDQGTEPGTTTTGPVISMPNTQSADGGEPFRTTFSPAEMMGIVDNPGGGDVEVGQAGSEASGMAVTGAGVVSDDPVRGGDAGRMVTENNEGPTMGQLGDTSVEAHPAPITRGEHEEVEGDRTHGYWRIG
jgi:hypothetical protein